MLAPARLQNRLRTNTNRLRKLRFPRTMRSFGVEKRQARRLLPATTTEKPAVSRRAFLIAAVKTVYGVTFTVAMIC